MGLSSLLEFWHDISEVGFEPLFGRVTCALIAEHPLLVCKPYEPGNSGSCLFQVIDVVRLLLHDALRHAMCCEQHCNALAYIRGEAIQCLLNALSQSLQKGGLHMPIPRDRQLQVITMQFGDGILERTHIALHDEWGVLW